MRTRARSVLRWSLLGLTAGLLLATVAVLILTHTDWGREQLRRAVLQLLDDAVEGEVRIGRIEGNILERIRLVDVSIVDAQGRPFVRADTIAVRVSLLPLVRRRIELGDVRLVRAEVVLDKPPREEWNFARIFPTEPDPDPPDVRWGYWIWLRDLELVETDVTVRTAWGPPLGLTPAQQREALQEALSPETRENVVPVPGGHQNVSQFLQLNALFPRVVLAHPRFDGIPIDVDRLSGFLLPFRPPAVVVHDLSGAFRIVRDSLFMQGVRAVLPDSRVWGEGVYALDTGELTILLDGAPLGLSDLRWLLPRLPEEGGGPVRLQVRRGALGTRIIARDADIEVRGSRIAGRIDLTLGDTVRLKDTDLRFEQLDTRLIADIFPGLESPRHGIVTGNVRMVGVPSALDVDGDVTFTDETGTSRILAEGVIGIDDEVRFRNLRLGFRPLQAALARTIVPLPLQGTVTGTTTLTGMVGGILEIDSDVTFHDPRGGPSRIRASGRVDTGEEARLLGLRVNMDPLHLEIFRGELPQLPAGATVVGEVVLDGTPGGRLRVDGDVALDDPQTGVSRIGATGGIDTSDGFVFRDLALRFDPLQGGLLPLVGLPELPTGSTLVGQVLLDGDPERFVRIDGEVALREPSTGVSRIGATGGIETVDGVVFRDLALRFDPLQGDLLPLLGFPELPPGSTVVGGVVLDGDPERFLRVDGDVALFEPRSGVSQIGATGGIEMVDGVAFRDLTLRFDPLQGDLLPLLGFPELPPGSTVVGGLLLDGDPERFLRVDGDVALFEPRSGVSQIAATGGIETVDGVAFRDLLLRFGPLRGELLPFVGLPELPPGSTVVGQVLLDGDPERFVQVDGDVTLFEPGSGVSRIGATGGIETVDGVAFRRLALRFDPLQVELLTALGAPEMAIAGTLEGTAVLDGSPDRRLLFDADVLHREAGEVSRLIGDGEFVQAPVRSLTVDLRLEPVSLVTVGRFFPEAGLVGSAWGTIRAGGTPAALDFQTDLVLPAGGALFGRGTLDLESARVGYDVFLDLRALDLAAVTTRAPVRTTDLTGPVAAVGRGTDPATMQARFTADLRGSTVDGVVAEEVRIRVAIADGLARIDSSFVRLDGAEALVDGSFGLVAWRQGVLSYAVAVDSLELLAPWVPGIDTVAVAPRPVVRRQDMAEEMERYERARRRALVERIATGRPSPDPQPPEPPPVETIPRDAVAGSVRVAGLLSGNVEAFDLEGQAELQEVVFRGSYVERGSVDFQLDGVGVPEAYMVVDSRFENLLVEGLVYDSAAVRGLYSGGRLGTGWVQFAAWQDESAAVEGAAEFTVFEEERELRLEEFGVRLDTVTWRNEGVGVVRWGVPGVEVRGLDLRSDQGGRVFVDGRLPVDADAELDLLVDDVDVGHFRAFLRDRVDVAGRLTLFARVVGPRGDPLISGDVAWTEATLRGADVPDAIGTFSYADLRLTAELEMFDEGVLLASLVATLPVDLTLEDTPGPRLLDAPLLVDLVADSLPMEVIRLITEEVTDVEGAFRGLVQVRGTFDDPQLGGSAVVEGGALTVTDLGVRVRDITGHLTLGGQAIVLDSLVGYSGGPIRVAGTVDVSSLTEPVFDLAVEAVEARVLDSRDGRLTADANIVVEGPLQAMTVTGDVVARRGVIYIPLLSEMGSTQVVGLDDPGTVEEVDMVMLAADRRIDRSPFLANLDLDIDVQIEREVWLRSLETNVEIYTPPEVGALRIRMPRGDRTVVLDGTIHAERGDYEFLSRRFRITRGAITFLPERDFDAILQVTAEHEVVIPGRSPFAIRVLVSGTLRDPEITLESSAQPPISQTDLLTYVALGRQASAILPIQGSALSGTGAGSGDLVGTVAALATQQLATAAVGTVVNELESEAARALNVDVFRITPADFPEELFRGGIGDVLRATEVEIGSYVTPRLFVAAQGRASSFPPGAVAEYLTPRGLRWVVSWQPRFLPSQPSLGTLPPRRVGVLGAFLFREWRF